ncbi:hypothetical protein ABZ802_31475 [Streptomyces sp. NPDC047737]|uniref:hypothetical protein n=1 Tax=Streptomyces sp. NPDC047737 TaxID=3155740 RepID=UPI0033DFB9C9
MSQPSLTTGRTAPTTPALDRMAVVHYNPLLHLTTETTLDRVKAGDTVTATVTLTSIRQTAGGRASGIVTALADQRSAIVTFSADTNRRLARILTTGNRLIVRGKVAIVNGQRVLDVRNGVAVTV